MSEGEIELTKLEQEIFDKVKEGYAETNKTMLNENAFKKMIKMANTEGDGLKRVSRMGKEEVYLVPIEDMILHGLKEEELDKYPVEKLEKNKMEK